MTKSNIMINAWNDNDFSRLQLPSLHVTPGNHSIALPKIGKRKNDQFGSFRVVPQQEKKLGDIKSSKKSYLA